MHLTLTHDKAELETLRPHHNPEKEQSNQSRHRAMSQNQF